MVSLVDMSIRITKHDSLNGNYLFSAYHGMFQGSSRYTKLAHDNISVAFTYVDVSSRRSMVCLLVDPLRQE